MFEEQPTVQLNIWITKDLKDYLSERAKRDNKPGMNIIVAELVRQERAREQGKILEQQSLPVIQEIIRQEVRQALAEQRRDLRSDRALEIDELRDYFRNAFDRLAGLTVHAIRNAGIGRRIAYTLLAKAYTPTFAQSVLDDAKEKVQRELLPKAKQKVE